MQRGGTTDYYDQDGLVSVTSLTATNGSIVQNYTYDSFGNTTASTGSLRNYFQYTGREFDTETGLYYYRARYYDPTTGRFLNEDLVRFRAGTNFYSYVRSNPNVFRDPFGLCPVTPQQRWDLAEAGLLDLAIGGIQAVVPIALAPETGGLSLLGGYNVYSGAVKAFGGLGQLAGAISGNVSAGESAGQLFNGLSTASGALTLALGGSSGEAETASSIEGLASFGATGAVESINDETVLDLFNPSENEPGNPLAPIGKGADTLDNAAGAFGLIAPSSQEPQSACGCSQ